MPRVHLAPALGCWLVTCARSHCFDMPICPVTHQWPTPECISLGITSQELGAWMPTFPQVHVSIFDMGTGWTQARQSPVLGCGCLAEHMLGPRHPRRFAVGTQPAGSDQIIPEAEPAAPDSSQAARESCSAAGAAPFISRDIYSAALASPRFPQGNSGCTFFPRKEA